MRTTVKDALTAASYLTPIPELRPGMDPKPVHERYARNVVTLALQALKFDERTARTLASNISGVPRVRLDKALRKLRYLPCED